MYEIKCTVEGVAPMLHNRYPMNAEPGSGKRKTQSIKDLKQTLNDKAYKDNKGMYLPANNIRMMLIGNQKRRGAATILGSDIEAGKGTRYVNFCKGCVFVLGLDGDQTKVYVQPNRKKWDDTHLSSYQRKDGSRNVIERPMINLPWQMTFNIVVYDDNFEEGKVRELFDTGGMRCGLGDFGPTFGRFIIKEWKLKTNK